MDSKILLGLGVLGVIGAAVFLDRPRSNPHPGWPLYLKINGVRYRLIEETGEEVFYAAKDGRTAEAGPDPAKEGAFIFDSHDRRGLRADSWEDLAAKVADAYGA